MKNIILGQVQVEAGQPEKNLARAVEAIKATPKGGLIILPEMLIPGYMIGDKWLQDNYISECRDMNKDLVEATLETGNSAVWGNIDFDKSKQNEDGSIRKYNTAYIASKGELIGKHYKTLLPNYGRFDDKRYFSSLKKLAREEINPPFNSLPNIREGGYNYLKEYYKPFEIEINGIKRKVAILICEDIWNTDNRYGINPVELTKSFEPDLIAVPSASPFEINKYKTRDSILKKQSEGTQLYYVNPIGTQNNGKNVFVFDGGSAIYKDGEKIGETKDYTENVEQASLTKSIEKSEISQIYESLIFAIRTEFENKGWKKVVIGLSGGIDSGLVIALLSIAIGSENIIAINMPSKFNSDTTKNLAYELAKNLKIDYRVYPIQDEIDLKVQKITNLTGEKPSNFEIENIQARERGQILADLSPRFKAIFTNNGNKDEFSTGYATLYGDTNGAICIIGDLHKEQVFELSRYINELNGKEIIPNKMIDMKPSAELGESQNVDEGWGDPFNYEFVSKIKKSFIQGKMTPYDILEMYRDGVLGKKIGLEKNINSYFNSPLEFIEEIEKLWTLKNGNYFKRVQAPPIITVSSDGFGFDYREAQNGVYFGRNYERIKSKILKNY